MNRPLKATIEQIVTMNAGQLMARLSLPTLYYGNEMILNGLFRSTYWPVGWGLGSASLPAEAKVGDRVTVEEDGAGYYQVAR